MSSKILHVAVVVFVIMLIGVSAQDFAVGASPALVVVM